MTEDEKTAVLDRARELLAAYGGFSLGAVNQAALLLGVGMTAAEHLELAGTLARTTVAPVGCPVCGNVEDNFFGGEHGEAFGLCGRCDHRWTPA